MGLPVRQRRLTAIKHSELSAISKRDVHDIAAIFIRGHGPTAARRAGEWADLMLDRGDRKGRATCPAGAERAGCLFGSGDGVPEVSLYPGPAVARSPDTNRTRAQIFHCRHSSLLYCHPLPLR